MKGSSYSTNSEARHGLSTESGKTRFCLIQHEVGTTDGDLKKVIDDAKCKEGDTIHVPEVTYNEALTIDHGLNIYGKGIDKTILAGTIQL
jgi:hypothetical protein